MYKILKNKILYYLMVSKRFSPLYVRLLLLLIVSRNVAERLKSFDMKHLPV